jgi:hypothetical protein
LIEQSTPLRIQFILAWLWISEDREEQKSTQLDWCKDVSMHTVTNLRLGRRSANCFALCFALLTTAALLFATADSAGAARHPNTPTHRRAGAAQCRALHLEGLVVGVARERVEQADCRLRLFGSPVKQPMIQTIRRQSFGKGPSGPFVTVWVNPLCSGSADWGSPAGEPVRTTGQTELVSGLYLDGGPHRFRSAPHCASLSGTPGAGTITVTEPASGAIVATETVADGQLAKIRLSAGTYTITGTFANASRDGQHIQSPPQTVTIRSGQTVRQDVSANIK